MMNKAEYAEAILSDAQRLLSAAHQTTMDAAADWQLHDALARAVMLHIAPQWMQDAQKRACGRQAAYISAEYLLGRLWHNNLFCLGLYADIERALSARGRHLADLEDIEDAALGNGGLGRLAACYLDAAATHGIPLTGYGLYYRFGLFRQSFEGGRQMEAPDDWTRHGDPWSVRREEAAVRVDFAGFSVNAVPFDVPVIGYQGDIGTLRLWRAEPLSPIDMPAFNAQNYDKASRDAVRAADITALLYPGDDRRAGKLLRLRQQYLLCSATVQDILRACPDARDLPQKFAVQLNDTHPVMAVPELIRLLTARGIPFEEAFSIAQRTFSFTNHTIMPEALECWSESLLRAVAPGLIPIIRQIQARLEAEGRGGLFILKDKTVHMADLAVYATHCTNGVAELHTDILKRDVFAAWHKAYPDRLQNVTNGVTPRRWLAVCNPELTALLRETLGNDDFLTDLEKLRALREKIDAPLIDRFMAVKLIKKEQLSAYIQKHEGITLPPDFLFDVQVKRLHEYKRQLMNALSIIDIHARLRADEAFRASFTPTAMIFGAKAAAGYARAKAIIYFCNSVAALVNADPLTNGLLRVVFVQNYNCSYAERIIPAADISQQISPAGTEASGTGNMKLMLNGALTLGTPDGANIEIARYAGLENEYIFGATADELSAAREHYDPIALYQADARLRHAIDMLDNGLIPDPDGGLAGLKSALLQGASWHKPDHHFVLRDFAAYQQARLQAYADYKADPRAFARKCLLNISAAGPFSADRAVKQYAGHIWKL